LDKTLGGLPMDAKMILVGAHIIGTVLSFTILFRALQLSLGLRLKEISYQRLPTWSDVEKPTENDQIFRA
jgi:hypothetical protein